MKAHIQNSLKDPKPSGLLAVDEARRRIVDAMTALDAEVIELSGALGRALANDVVAIVSHPPMPVSAMDGYACRWADVDLLPARLRMIGTSKAGLPFCGELQPGTCVRIFTGAVVPPGADVIVLQEDAQETSGAVEVAEVPKRGQFIRPVGQDFDAGQRCVEHGRILTARDVGMIASCGHANVSVCRKPRIAIFSTGDELVTPGTISHASDRIAATPQAACR